jgi:hypothetical protein
MPDEFDDELLPPPRGAGRSETSPAAAHPPVARVVSRLYAGVQAPLRARLLGALLRPLGPLGMSAVAAGAFAVFLGRGGARSADVGLADVDRITHEQVFELVHFVEQVDPEAVRQAVSQVAEGAGSIAAFSGAVALLALQLLRSARDDGATAADVAPPSRRRGRRPDAPADDHS